MLRSDFLLLLPGFFAAFSSCKRAFHPVRTKLLFYFQSAECSRISLIFKSIQALSLAAGFSLAGESISVR